MNISGINNQKFQAKNLIPLSQYKGPVLKLTPKDKEKIGQLMGKKTDLLFELDSINRLLEKRHKTITKEWQKLSNAQITISYQIEKIDNLIKEIKINRLNKQKKKLEKLDKKA